METLKKNVLALVFDAATTYADWTNLIDVLAAEGKTTGSPTEANVNYTKLNNSRMRRWDKTFQLSQDDLKQLGKMKKNMAWLVLTESWCGDAAPSLPVMHKIAEASSFINFRVAQRDKHPELMEQFLTNGSKSIPKLIAFDPSSFKVLFTWGPRPEELTKMVTDYKETHGKITPEFREEIQKWYNANKGESIKKELMALLALE